MRWDLRSTVEWSWRSSQWSVHDEPVREEGVEQEGRLVAGGAMPGSLMVNGIEMTETARASSSLRLLWHQHFW